MRIAVEILVIAALAMLAVWLLRRRDARRSGAPVSERRILFPFPGARLSEAALEAAIRLARAEQATLVPAYLAEVPLTLPLASALPKQAETALPILEAIEQRGQRSGISVDPRIERGRTNRHALSELLEHEPYDRIVAPAAAGGSDGFSPGDVAWLLDHASGDIVVFRAGNGAGPH